MEEYTGPDLNHDDSIIKLSSAVHRFRCPLISNNEKLSFSNSFKTSGSDPRTQQALREADRARNLFTESLEGASGNGKKINNQSILETAEVYRPKIHQILVTCKVRPDRARLDSRLFFAWQSGAESNGAKGRKTFQSEALMYELCMTIASEAMATAGLACDESANGDFASSANHYKRAAGIFEFLGETQLPKWVARGSSVEEKDLPVEVTIGFCKGFKILFLAMAQQMAVATTLMKVGTPNYSVLAKLCMGIADQIEEGVTIMRSKAGLQMQKIDKTFFTLLTCQINMQRSFSSYFLARCLWDKDEYGVAIAMLNDARIGIKTRYTATSRGVPEIDQNSPLRSLLCDLDKARAHMDFVMRVWEKDNSTVYFERVPTSIPQGKKLAAGVNLMKAVSYSLEDNIEPLPLSVPGKLPSAVSPAGLQSLDPPPPPPYDALKKSDSDLARELQEKLNAGEDL